LYYTDETWALEGPDGFFKREIPGMGTVALGICTDIKCVNDLSRIQIWIRSANLHNSPYKLEAPWDAFEFGFHVLHARANLVILTMAWQAPPDDANYLQNLTDPDIDTLVYWVQRLEPLIRADNDEEVIVVFCNRSGTEGEVTYTGTSAVIGIKGGEVFVYGVLGRGVSEVLIVDTDQPPVSKLADPDAVAPEQHTEQPLQHRVQEEAPIHQTTALASDSNDPITTQRERPVLHCQVPPLNPQPELHPSPALSGHRSPTSPRFPWLAQSEPGQAPPDSRSPTRLQIPTRPAIISSPENYVGLDSAIIATDDVIIDTPAAFEDGAPASAAARGIRSHHLNRIAPSATRRKHVASPWSPFAPWRFPSRPSQYCHDAGGAQPAVFSAGATMTPITPFEDDGGWSATPIDPKMPPPWWWKHEPKLSALKESIVEEEEVEEKQNGVAEGNQPMKLEEVEASEKQKERVLSEKEGEVSGRAEAEAKPAERSVPLDNWADLNISLDQIKEQSSPHQNEPAPVGDAEQYHYQSLSSWALEQRDSPQFDDDNDSVCGQLGYSLSRDPSPEKRLETGPQEQPYRKEGDNHAAGTGIGSPSNNTTARTRTDTQQQQQQPQRQEEFQHVQPGTTDEPLLHKTTTPSLCSFVTSTASASQLSVATPDDDYDEHQHPFDDGDGRYGYDFQDHNSPFVENGRFDAEVIDDTLGDDSGYAATSEQVGVAQKEKDWDGSLASPPASGAAVRGGWEFRNPYRHSFPY
jgi:hypothetical protein